MASPTFREIIGRVRKDCATFWGASGLRFGVGCLPSQAKDRVASHPARSVPGPGFRGGRSRQGKTSESRPMRHGGIDVGVGHEFHVDVVRELSSHGRVVGVSSINPHTSPHIPTPPCRHYYRRK